MGWDGLGWETLRGMSPGCCLLVVPFNCVRCLAAGKELCCWFPYLPENTRSRLNPSIQFNLPRDPLPACMQEIHPLHPFQPLQDSPLLHPKLTQSDQDPSSTGHTFTAHFLSPPGPFEPPAQVTASTLLTVQESPPQSSLSCLCLASWV